MKKHLVCFRITNVYKNGLKQIAVEALATYGSVCLLSQTDQVIQNAAIFKKEIKGSSDEIISNTKHHPNSFSSAYFTIVRFSILNHVCVGYTFILYSKINCHYS